MLINTEILMMNHQLHLHLMMMAVVSICDLSVIAATPCEERCDYTYDLGIQDVNCHGRNLVRLPEGCETAWTLQAGKNNFTALDDTTFRGFTQLKNLYISKGIIQSITPGALDSFASTIGVISITSNRITVLENGTFVAMRRLGQLDLQSNLIESVAARAFQDLQSLTHLYLSNNLIRMLPPSVFDGTPRLEILHIGNNSLHDIDSRLFLHLHSLEQVRLSQNEINSLTGAPLGVGRQSLQLLEFDLSQNNLTIFYCTWIGPMAGYVNLSMNSITSISDCGQANARYLILKSNPFDCGCDSEEVAGIYRALPEVTAPTCGGPLSERNKTLRDVSYEDCNRIETTAPPLRVPVSESTTEIILQRPKTTRKIEKMMTRKITTKRLIVQNEEREFTTSFHQPTAANSFFTPENQVFIIPVIIVAGSISVILIISMSYCLLKRRGDQETTPPIYRTSIRDVTPTASRPGTGQLGGSHVYEMIPADERSVVNRNSNRFPPSNADGDLSEGGLDDRWYPRHYLSDSQDSGLADQGRNSLHEWLQTHVDTSFLTPRESSIVYLPPCCEECFYLQIKSERGSLELSESLKQQVIAAPTVPGRPSVEHGRSHRTEKTVLAHSRALVPQESRDIQPVLHGRSQPVHQIEGTAPAHIEALVPQEARETFMGKARVKPPVPIRGVRCTPMTVGQNRVVAGEGTQKVRRVVGRQGGLGRTRLPPVMPVLRDNELPSPSDDSGLDRTQCSSCHKYWGVDQVKRTNPVEEHSHMSGKAPVSSVYVPHTIVNLS